MPIFIFVAVVGTLIPITLLLTKLVRPHNPQREKLLPYECGIEVHWMTDGEIRDLIARGEVTNAPMLASWALYTCRSRSS